MPYLVRHVCCSQCGLCTVDGVTCVLFPVWFVCTVDGETCVLFSVWFVYCGWGDMCGLCAL